MLKTLTVWNFALIEHAQIDFGEGLNILTGETGAGKSILIDSVSVILGHRVSADHIRAASDWLRVEAVFDVAAYPEIHEFLTEHGILGDEEFLIISRQISRGGKNMVRVNGCQITMTLLKAFGEMLVDIHGQNENQALLKSSSQFALVDGYQEEIKGILHAYRAAYQAWQDLNAQLKQKEADSREYARRLDMLQWQSSEIETAKLRAGEDTELETEIKVLANAEKIAELMKESYQLMQGGGRGETAVLSALSQVKRNLEMACRYDDRLSGALGLVTEAACQLEECSYEVRDYGDGLDYSPERLNKLQERMDVIYKLCKKYGATIEDVLAHYERVRAELDEIENYDQIITEAKTRLTQTETALTLSGAQLTIRRRASADRLSAEIQSHLRSLGMPDARMQIEILPLGKLGPSGADEIRMMFSANLGEELKPMQKVASGGELSRIALAIKTVCASRDKVGVMIFDEIDAGIGGKTAQMVAERIAMVSAHKQVLCITHLPQIACMADVHLYIDKHAAEGKTTTRIKRLTASEQSSELARMASGMDATAAALENALEMLQRANIKKEKWRRLADRG